jgi:NDP-sugar pyrophosphorylase family protein
MKMKIQVIIPMSGSGQRFIDAGYKPIKPLIKVEGKPIIQHVVERFSPDDDFIFICNEEHLQTTELHDVLTSIAPKCKIISIAPHKLGPVYAVTQANAHISDELPTIVNYCDFSWRWDYLHFKETMIKTECDGAVISYKGFHPHLLGSNTYASMKDDGNNWMIEIKEKHSYTENKMDCFQSSGTYYFRNGCIVKENFQALLDEGPELNNEYYVSLVYNKMIDRSYKVYIYGIPIFMQWGTPQDLEEYLYWSEYFS